MILSARKLVAGVFAVGAVAAVIVACGSDPDSKFKDPGITPGFFPDGGFNPDGGDDPNGDLFKNDPPPAFCGPETGAPQPPPIGGTEECPDDKNKPNCGCATVGEEADCWTGLRKNRNLGVCKDGRTKCVKKTENENVWGPCVGQTLPKENATGELACSCFSVGLWKIANTAPCIWSDAAGFYSYSTQMKKDANGNIYAGHCGEGSVDPTKPTGPANPPLFMPRGQKAPETWSSDTLTTDCAGTFTLLFRIRVGDFNNPKPTDCILGESEVFADYRQENVEQALPNLPHWNTTDTACATQWEQGKPGTESPGYGEMIVKGGQTVRCENVAPVGNDTEFVFNRIQFCGRDCRNDANGNPPTAEACKQCALNGSGSF